MALTLQQRILFTLAYTLQFDYPLTTVELYRRLVGKNKVTQKNFLSELKKMVGSEKLVYKSGYFFLGNVSLNTVEKLIETRSKRFKYSQKKWAESTVFINLVKRIPFISGVAVTGSVAMNNAVRDDDVDFLIVTQTHRLWITRLILVGIASFFGKRRSFAQEEKNSWCFNLWVETTDIQLPPKSRSVYEAYEVLQTKWVYSRNNIAERFFVSNAWIKNILPHAETHCLENNSEILPTWSSVSLLKIVLYLFDLILDVCNYLSFLVQYWYMKRHMTREKVSLSHAFFHPRDTKKQVLSNVSKLLTLQKAA